MNVQAYMNHGRWLLNCQRCGSPLPADLGSGFTVCPVCHPDMVAWGFQHAADGIFRRVSDETARRAAVRRAQDAGEAYTAVYPDFVEKLDKVLRARNIENMNWMPGESLQNIAEENRARGLPTGLEG